MTKLIMYLLESSIVLVFFYTFYILVLRKETFFNLNRFFLLGILIFSLIFPFLSFDFSSEKVLVVKRPIEEISKVRMSYYEAMALWEFDNLKRDSDARINVAEGAAITSKGYWIKNFIIILSCFYACGVLLCLSKLLWTFRWIGFMIYSYPHEKIGGVKVIKVHKIIAPFSFLNYVFVHDEVINTPEFDQILLHEKTHIRELHSIDLIFVQLLAAFFWFNPVIWQLIKSLKTTHEYIADRKIITSGYSLVEYQTLLLRQLISNNSYGLVHNFNLSFIKKRITMMKNKQSGWTGKVKVAIAIISTIIFSIMIIQCNSLIEEQEPAHIVTLSKNSFSEESKTDLNARKDSNVLEFFNALNINNLDNKRNRYNLNNNSDDEQPQYTGGNDILRKEFARAINYPEEAKTKYVQLKLFVLIEISAEGKITSSEFLTQDPEGKKLSEILVYAYPDQNKAVEKLYIKESEKVAFFKDELDRVISTLKDFEPATKDGVPISSRLIIPLTFSLR